MFRIWCEWDMGMNWENRVFSSREKAERELDKADWELAETTLKEALEDGLVSIEEIECV